MHVFSPVVTRGPLLPALFGVLCSFSAPAIHAATESAGLTAPVVAPAMQFPVRFERNDGQAHPDVHYLARGRGYRLFLTAAAALLALPGVSADGHSVVRMQFVGADPEAPVQGADPQEEQRHYLIGNDPADWRTGIPTYSEVRYRELYAGIDLVFHGAHRAMEYDFIVRPGASPETIRLQISGADSAIDERGNLVLRTGDHELVQQVPVIYQTVAGSRRPIDGRFVFVADNQVGFEVAAYDTTRDLVIDPVITYATLFGGSGNDTGRGIALNTSATVSANGIYITGETDSPDFSPAGTVFQPVFGDNTDAFVVKLNPFGTQVVYTAYLGGNGNDSSSAIAVDGTGNVYVTGTTLSTNFPVSSGAHDGLCGISGGCDGGLSDAFVAKLNPAGDTLLFSTYLGGNDNDSGAAIALDSAGNNVYVGGETLSADFPTAGLSFQSTRNGTRTDGYIAKFTNTGTLVYSTFLGGTSDDSIAGIAADGAGNAYVTGVTFSSDFPKSNGAFQESQSGLAGDAFVTKLSTTGGNLQYSTYLGGINFDRGSAIAVDSFGSAYVTGATVSTDFPTVNPVQAAHASGGGTRDAFVARLNTTGTDLDFSTFIGGDGTDNSNGIAVDGSGNAYITGQTVAPDFPVAAAVQGFMLGDSDAFVVSLDGAGTLRYATYLGGSGNDFGSGIALDEVGVAYIVGGSSQPETANVSTNQIADLYAGSSALGFPSALPLQPSLRGASDAFIARIAPTLSAALAVTKVNDSTASVVAGTQYSSTVLITNTGPDTANDIFVVDTQPVTLDLPLPITVNSATPSQGGCSIEDNVAVCEIGNLASGTSATIQLTYTPASEGNYTRAALLIRARESDPDAADNVASITTRVVSSGSGSSGGITPLWVTALLGALLLRRWRTRSFWS